MVRVGVLGAAGHMGREVCRAVRAAQGLQLVAMVDPRLVAGPSAAQEDPGVPTFRDIDALSDAKVEVAVDFTVAQAARRNLRWCAEHGVHAVVGTTGLGEGDLGELGKLFANSTANAIVAPNFALGAALLMRFCEIAARWLRGAEIIELHHDHKRDAPSGTALATASRIASAREAAGVSPTADPTTTVALHGARGGQGPGGVRVHAVRLPGLVAHQEVIFGDVGQALTIRHDTTDRAAFMPGVELAIRSVASRPGLTVGLDSLLEL